MNLIRKSAEAVIVFLFVVLVSAVFFQVIARYLFSKPPSWSEELARYCQVWIVILTSSLCIRKGSHLAVDYFGGRFGIKIHKSIHFFINVLMIAYAAAVAFYGVRLMLVGHYQVSPAMQINMSIIYVIFPLGGCLMTLEAVLKTVKDLSSPPGTESCCEE